MIFWGATIVSHDCPWENDINIKKKMKKMSHQYEKDKNGKIMINLKICEKWRENSQWQKGPNIV